MKTLNQYLITESAEEEKLKHLEHAEDHVINAGKEGFKHAFNTLHGVHTALTKKKSEVSVSHKFDGSPSIVFGHNPENGRFFVASKSAFNVNPKLNYSLSDIDKNHGHAPGLVSKLKAALRHLPKTERKLKAYELWNAIPNFRRIRRPDAYCFEERRSPRSNRTKKWLELQKNSSKTSK